MIPAMFPMSAPLIFLLSAITLSLALTTPLKVRRTPPNTSGPVVPYYLSWWTDGDIDANYVNGAGGQFSVQWTDNGGGGRLLAGKGWNPGTYTRVIQYSGSFKSGVTSVSSLSVYGWTRNPLVEYHIIETYSNGIYPLVNATQVGTTMCDNATYTTYLSSQTNKPSINGNSTNFQQYWSVRSPKKEPINSGGSINGSVSLSCHFTAWGQSGMRLGSYDYQIVATEAIGGIGTSVISIA